MGMFLDKPTNLSITIDKAELIAEAVSKGLDYKDAAALLGIPFSTVNQYRMDTIRLLNDEVEKIRNTSEEYFNVLRALAILLPAAEAKLKQKHLANINEIAETGEKDSDKLRASQWILERKFPTEFGRRSTQIIDKTVTTKKAETNIKEKSTAELEEELASIKIVEGKAHD